MIDSNLFSSVREILAPAQTVLILIPSNPNLDRVAAGLGLFLALKKLEKKPTAVCPTEMTVGFSDLVGVDKIQKKMNGQNLVISFDYLEDSIEKVSYHIENNKFNLVIQPKAGFPPLSPEKVHYSYSGGEADLVFAIGAKSRRSFGRLASALQSSVGKQPLVNIDIHPQNEQFGQVNLVEPGASSCSEIVVRLISHLGLPVDEDIASNLLLGIERATNNFASSRVQATTFEAAAFCLRSGARRIISSSRRRESTKVALRPMPTEVSAAKKPVTSSEEKTKEEKKPSPDWLEPKIYKGNTRI